MRRSEGEKQGVGPEEGKKKKQTEDEQKERRNGRNRSKRAAMINVCGSFGIVGFCKDLNFESRVCYKMKNSGV